MFRSTAALMVLSMLSPAAMWSAKQAAPDSETISSTTELVLVPAQVKGKDGKPLLGLRQSDFVVRSDSKPQKISVFEETTRTAATAAPRTPTPIPSNMVLSVPNDGMPDQILILALDLVNTPFQDQARARRELVKYLQGQLPNQHFALVAITKDGLQQIHNVTSDPAVLVQALQHVQGTTDKDASDEEILDRIVSEDQFAGNLSPIAEYNMLVAAFNETQIYGAYRQKIAARATLTALKQIAQAFAGVPGRKSVVWITGGMPTVVYDPFAGGVNGNATLNGDAELLPDYDAAFRALNNANIAIYGVDIKGLKLDRTYQATGFQSAANRRATTALIYGPGQTIKPGDYQDDAIKVLSAQTGGKSCTANAGLKDCIDEAIADSSSYYLLGFYVPQQERKAGWHKLEVKLANERGSVRARSSYYLAATTSPTEKEVDRSLRDAANAHIGYTGIGFAVEREADRDTAKAGASAPLSMRIIVPARSVLLAPGHPQLSYDIVSVPLTSKGEPAADLRVIHLNLNEQQTQTALVKGWTFTDQPPRAGTQAVKYVLRDNGTGRIGSVIVPLQNKAGG
jgi:VWFA-related protein